MDDDRVWSFEKSLWTADAERYRNLIDDECLMVLPEKPAVRQGEDAIAAVTATPRWSEVELSDRRIVRPQEGLVVVAYRVDARKDGAPDYTAHCTSTYRRLGPEEWRVVQHQQTPPVTVA